MRIASLLVAAAVPLAACGGPQTSQANNAQANISNDSRTDVNAQASAVTPSDTNGGNSE